MATTAFAPRSEPLAALPASFAQERMWFLDQVELDRPVYNLPWARRLRGPLDLDSLQAALNQLVARHETLRTTYELVDGALRQVVWPATALALRQDDLHGLPDPERHAAEMASAEAERRFDLRADWPVRARLLRLDRLDHILVLTLHHIAADGWSMGTLTRELGALYRGHAAGDPVELPVLPIQYADYAVWQREQVEAGALDHQLSYWRGELHDAPTVLELPYDRPRPAVQSFAGARVQRMLPADLVRRLRALAAGERATPFMVFLAAFAVLLHRYSQQEDLVVATPVAGRGRVELEGVVGLFVNTLALRLRPAASLSFRELLAHVRQTTAGAYDNQDYPFHKLVEKLGPHRRLSHAPLAQVLISLQGAPAQTALELPRLTLEPVGTERATAKFDLSLLLSERSDGVRATLEYATALFERHTAERTLAHYRTLLEAIVAHPDRPLAELSLADEGERRRLLELAGTTTAYEREATVAEVFAARVAERPEAIAISCGGQTLTYGELDRRTNQLAHRLRALGVEPRARVAACVERSLDLVVAMLAIVKAGGTYVPVPPSDPQARVRAQLERLGVTVALTHARHRPLLSGEAVRILCLDQPLDSGGRAEPPPAAVEPTDPVYVMFTSGSTGTPRGVEVPHRAVVRLVRGADYVKLGPDQTLLALAPPSFDASTFEVWGALLNGGRLAVAPPGQLSVAELAELLAREGVSTLWLTAGLFHRVVDDRPQMLGSVRQLLAGGAVLSPDHVRRALAALPADGALINGYGPTEGTTFTCTHRLAPGDEVCGPVPIGRPIANTRVYLLDSDMRLAPLGVPGELWIGGDGVALGYAGDRGLTVDRFRPDPFTQAPGARMYRSGDRARWRADGTLEFLGRSDRQLKVRGFRVEPAEVEEALRSHPGVADAYVGPYEQVGGELALAAYVVPQAGAMPTDGELRAHLADTLPPYLIPSGWSRLRALPLTANGKVDAAALPTPHARVPRPSALKADSLERCLIAIWERLLDAGGVMPDDDFFELGGHSLLAVRLVAEIERELGVRLSLVELFRQPTVRHLAAVIRNHSTVTPVAELARGARGRVPMFLFPSIDGELLSYRPLVLRLDPGQPVYGLEAAGVLPGTHPGRTVEQMAARHAETIRRMRPRGPYLLAGHCFAGVVAFHAARILEDAGEEVQRVLLIDSSPVSSRSRRVDKERLYLADFAGRDLKGRLAWVAMRAANLSEKVQERAWHGALAALIRAGRPLPDRFLDLPRINWAAWRRYEAPTLHAPVTLFRAGSPGGKRSRWRDFAHGELHEIWIDVPGIDHNSIIHEPYVSALATELSAHLESLHRPLASEESTK